VKIYHEAYYYYISSKNGEIEVLLFTCKLTVSINQSCRRTASSIRVHSYAHFRTADRQLCASCAWCAPNFMNGAHRAHRAREFGTSTYLQPNIFTSNQQTCGVSVPIRSEANTDNRKHRRGVLVRKCTISCAPTLFPCAMRTVDTSKSVRRQLCV
jgi:hypothetical protein